jgi:transposase
MGKGVTEKVVREIRRETRRRFSAEEKVRIVLEGLRGASYRGASRSRRARRTSGLIPG